MELSLDTLGGLVRDTLRQPQVAARRVIAGKLTMPVRWQLLALVAMLSVLTTALAEIVLTRGTSRGMTAMMGGPVVGVVLTAVVLAGMVLIVYGVGRGFGGTAAFGDTLQLMTWLQFLLMLVQVLQVMALLLAPVIAQVIGIAGIVLFFWLLSNFVLVLHGFKSLGKVFVTILVTMFAITFLAALALTMLGITPMIRV